MNFLRTSHHCIKQAQPRLYSCRMTHTDVTSVAKTSELSRNWLSLLISICAMGSSLFIGLKQLKSDEEKDDERIIKAEDNLKKELKKVSTYGTYLKYQPFLKDINLEKALKEDILNEIPGAVVVLCPKDSGKSTRLYKSLKDLTEKGKVYGAFKVNEEAFCASELPVMDSVVKHLQAPRGTDLWSLLPKNMGESPAIFVVDNIDRIINNKKEVEMKRLYTFVESMSMQSVVSSVNQKFKTYVLTSDPYVAQNLLKINGGKKVRLLAEGKSMVGGDPRKKADYWAHDGIKLKSKDVESAVDSFDEYNKLQLSTAERTSIIDLGIKAGTVGFIRDVFNNLASVDPEKRLNVLREEPSEWAEDQEQQWAKCMGVHHERSVRNKYWFF